MDTFFMQIKAKILLFLRLLTLCLVFLSHKSSALAQCSSSIPDASILIQKVSQRYSQVSSLKANFEQSSFFLGLGDTVRSSGTLAFKKPGRMDWSYTQPDPQRFISDGSKVWFYQPDLNQVTVGDFQKAFSSDIPVTFLLGVGELSSSFELIKGCQSDKGYEFFLKPKAQDPNLKDFVLYVDTQSLLPKGAKGNRRWW